MPLQAIQTHYGGHFFRSRAEARFAVFLDSLGVKWEYESEGYRLIGIGNYLPDFRLPDLKVWIEIKGTEPSATEKRKARALAIEAGEPVYVFFGGMGDPEFRSEPNRVVDGARAIGFGTTPAYPDNEGTKNFDISAVWAECQSCGAVDIVTISRTGQINRYVCTCFKKSMTPHGKYLQLAYAAARTARFEHADYNRRAPRLRPMLRATPTFTPARAPTLSLVDLLARWDSIKAEIFPTVFDRAIFHSARLVGVDGKRLIIQISQGTLLLLKDEKKREIRGNLIRLFGKGADVTFIDDKTPHGSN